MRAMGRIAAVVVAAGVLATGCSGGVENADGSAARPDRGGKPASTGGAYEGPGGGSGGQVAPESDAAAGAQDAEGQRKDGAREPVPEDMLSTFALDVDTASYGYSKRQINDGVLPSPETVRTEEFINSFRQDYPEPKDDGFSVTAGGARTGDEDWSLMRVGLRTRDDGAERRRDAALTFVVDVSGSMAEPGRLDLVQDAMHTMVDELRPSDSVAIVAFSSEAEAVLPMTRVSRKERLHDAIDELVVKDSTNVAAGLRLGYRQAERGFREGATNRVVLLSDALANTGETEAEPMLDQVADAREEYGITLLGVGVGSSYGDALMERLADQGDGLTVYVSEKEDAERVFTQQLPANLDLRARDAKAQVAFDRESVRSFRLIGYDNRRVADEDFRDDSVDGGEIGPGHTVTALYAVKLRQGASGRVATATVRWLDPDSRKPSESAETVSTGDFESGLWSSETPIRFRVSAVAAYLADALRGRGPEPYDRGHTDEYGGDGDSAYPSEQRYAYRPMPGSPSLATLAARADDLYKATEDPAVRDLAGLIDRVREMGPAAER